MSDLDLDDVKDLLNALLKQSTKLGVVVQEVERQGRKNAEATEKLTKAYETLANEGLSTKQDLKVIAASLEALEEDSSKNTSAIKRMCKQIDKVEIVAVDSREMIEALHTRMLEEANVLGIADRGMQAQIDKLTEAEDERRAAGAAGE